MDKPRKPRKPHPAHKPPTLVSSAREARAATPKPTPSKAFKVTGIPAVLALVAQRARDVDQLYLDEAVRPALADACQALAAQHKPYKLVGDEELARIAGTALHGGVVALSKPRPVIEFDHIHAQAWAAERMPLVVLDGVSNPHNLGAIVRTLAFFGLGHLVISDHPQQAGPSEAAYRVAEGGFEFVELHRARFPQALRRLRDHYHVLGTALGQGRALEAVGGPRPLAVVLGNEEDGLPATTLASCDELATIAGSGRIQSLNVAATAAIVAHVLTRKRPVSPSPAGGKGPG